MSNRLKNCLTYVLLLLTIGSLAFSITLYIRFLAPVINERDFYNNNLHTTVEIVASNDSFGVAGTATCIDKNLFITNSHVVIQTVDDTPMPYPNCKYRFTDETEYSDFKVLKFDLKKDIALLEIISNKSQEVTIDSSNKVSIGDTVYTFGNAHNQGLTMSKGIIATRNVSINETLYYCSDNRVSNGCSGGGLYLNNGKFIGMITQITENGDLTYSLQAKEILNFIGGEI